MLWLVALRWPKSDERAISAAKSVWSSESSLKEASQQAEAENRCSKYREEKVGGNKDAAPDRRFLASLFLNINNAG